MSNQNRFLLPHTPTAGSATATNRPDSSSSTGGGNQQNSSCISSSSQLDQENNQLSVDTDFDSYWEEEARNPHRNRIRIGRQYQATVPPLLKPGEKDQRKLDELETLSFCPKRSARVSNAELDHYFTVAKSLNLFASLVETRSLLGRDVTIADLNHIRHKEGLSLASVIQPVRQSANYANSNVSPQSSQPNNLTSTSTGVAGGGGQQAPQKSPPTNSDNRPSSSSTSSSSPREALTSHENCTFNQPLMKALSHFISLHHPCHHDSNCKKLLKDMPLEDDSVPVVSITAGNLRQSSSASSKDSKSGRSRSSLKQNPPTVSPIKSDEPENEQDQAGGDSVQSPSYDDWTREEVELFSKAIEVCGKNFGSIKKEFLPSKSVKSIVEYYYIGSRDVSESKKKSNQTVDTSDSCNSPEKPLVNNNTQGGGGGSSTSGKSGSNSNVTGPTNSSSRASGSNNDNSSNANSSRMLSDSSDGGVKRMPSNQDVSNKTTPNSKQFKNEDSSSISKTKTKNIDARMSVYNFDDEFKEDSPFSFDCPRPGAEVKPLKAKPIIPNASMESEAGNSNVGSLKFFMDGQLVLKLNACQGQQEGIEKCQWVQSSERVAPPNSRQKRFTKRASDRLSSDPSHNGSQSNSVVSSNQDEDSKNEDLTADEDSKESANSFTNATAPKQKSFSASPTPKRLKTKNDTNVAQQPHQQQQAQLTSPIDYNRIAVNNRMKERNDNLTQSPIVNQAATMPWLQANSFAMAAALLGGLPFPAATGNLVGTQVQNNASAVNMASKPMDLSHNSPKPIQTKPASRSRSRPKNT